MLRTFVNQELCQILLIYYITLAGLLCIFRLITYVKIQMKFSIDRYSPLSMQSKNTNVRISERECRIVTSSENNEQVSPFSIILGQVLNLITSPYFSLIEISVAKTSFL